MGAAALPNAKTQVMWHLLVQDHLKLSQLLPWGFGVHWLHVLGNLQTECHPLIVTKRINVTSFPTFIVFYFHCHRNFKQNSTSCVLAGLANSTRTTIVTTVDVSESIKMRQYLPLAAWDLDRVQYPRLFEKDRIYYTLIQLLIFSQIGENAIAYMLWMKRIYQEMS